MGDPLLLWAAVKLGTFFALLAMAYYLVNRCTGILNFATGAYAMVAAIAYGTLASHGFSLTLAVLAALLLSASIAVVTETLVLRPISRAKDGEFGAVLALVATLFVVQQLAAMVFGRLPVLAPRFTDHRWRIGDVSLGAHDVITVVASLLVLLITIVWLSRGRYGRMMRAIGDNEAAAAGVGLSVPMIRGAVAALAGAIGGLAGVLYAPQAGVTFESATYFALAGFIAFVVGGGALPWGALLGGLLVGLIEVYGVVVVGSSSRDYIFLAVMLCLFAVRPQGLLAVKERV